jgi:hypothetical protein
LAEQHFFERAAGMNQTGKFLARPIRWLESARAIAWHQ